MKPGDQYGWTCQHVSNNAGPCWKCAPDYRSCWPNPVTSSPATPLTFRRSSASRKSRAYSPLNTGFPRRVPLYGTTWRIA